MASSTGTQEPLITSSEIKAFFRNPLQPIATASSYRMHLVAVLASLVLLQVVYLALVAAAGVGVVYYITLLPVIFDSIRIQAYTLVLVLSPIAAGVIAFFFMLKPLLARQAKPPRPLEIYATEQPELFEFVGSLCRKLGAPVPSRILVDLQVNASASLGGTWLSLFRRQPVLTIGLPLVSGLSLAQFTGVLAHEFGHFTQAAGMRSWFLIGSILNWFARVAYERDSWDEALQNWFEDSGTYGKIVASVAAFAVWLSRQVLRGLLHVAQIVASAFSRQMEFNADLHQVAIVGPDVATSTLFELRNLATAGQITWSQLEQSWKSKRLIASFPEMVRHVREAFNDTTLVSLRDAELGETTERFSTHPSGPDRIANFERAGFAGIGAFPGTAKRIFRDFDTLAEQATSHQYGLTLGDELHNATVLGAQEMAEHYSRSQTYENALRVVCGDREMPWRWLELPAEPGEKSLPKSSAAAFTEQEFFNRLQTLISRNSGSVIIGTRANINPESFALSSGDPASAREALQSAEADYLEALASMSDASVPAANRISEGVARAIEAGVKGPDFDGPTTWKAYQAMVAQRPSMLALRLALIARIEVQRNAHLLPAAECANALDAAARDAEAAMKEASGRLAQVESQLSVEGRTGSLANALTGPETDPVDRAITFLNTYDPVAAQILGRLAWLALEAE